MTRRAPLPGAAELFRTTARSSAESKGSGDEQDVPPSNVGRPGSGRRKHDAKITVYVSDEELLSLEQARLALRADHGISVDRGRVVREAIAVLLADLGERGENSVLVRRFRQERGE